MSPRNKGIMYAASAAFMWGFLAIVLKVSLDYIPALTIVWLRFLVAFVLLVPLLYWKQPRALKIFKKPPVLGIVAALGLTFNYIGYIKGLELTTPSNTQVVIQMAPLMLALVGLVVYKERLSWWQSLGFVVAVGGFFVFYRDQLANLMGSADIYQAGVYWVLAAALAWVLFAALQKSLVQRYPAQGLNALIYLVPVLIAWPLADFEAMAGFSLGVWLLVVFLGLNTLLAYGAIAEAFKYIPANKVGIIVIVNPLITIAAMGVLTWMEVSWIEGERISALGVVGAVMILAGVSLAVKAKKAPPAVATKKVAVGLEK